MNEPDPQDELAVSSIELSDIGQTLIELGKQLIAAGQLTENMRSQPAGIQEAYDYGTSEQAEAVHDAHYRAQQDALARTLTSMNAFRRGYERWERLAVEYGLTRLEFTQRRTATLLGVGLSTVNRWNQNPLPADPER